MRRVIFALALSLGLSWVVIGTADAQQQAQGGGKGKGGGGGAGKGKGVQPPAAPAPRDASGKIILNGETPGKNGVWTPQIGITVPAAELQNVTFQPWSKALYDERQKHELEPHARCKPSGAARQFMTPYGVEFVEIPDLKRIMIFDIG